jgi:hypothetical protein
MNSTRPAPRRKNRIAPQWQGLEGAWRVVDERCNCELRSCLHCGVRNIVFIGGDNPAQALVGGLVKGGRPGASIIVISRAKTRRRLVGRYGALRGRRRGRSCRGDRRLGGEAAGLRGRRQAL